jgi:AcrR family transcriptional regulator
VPSPRPNRRTQAERATETRDRLIEAAIACLVDDGYAFTTTVSICARAGLTRGAYNHHYLDASSLYIDVLEWLYSKFGSDALATRSNPSVEDFIAHGWQKAKRAEFKAIIEIWLASRNDPVVGQALAPAIEKFSGLFAPHSNPKLAERFGSDPALLKFYRLAFETMIGLALGRATSPKGTPVSHEDDVIELLLSLAREHDQRLQTEFN